MTVSDTSVPASAHPKAALRGAVLVGIGLALAQVTSYLLSLISARVLGPEIFGALASMLALMLVGNVLALGIQAAGARRIVLMPHGTTTAGASGVVRFSIISGLAVAIVTALLSPLLTSLLHLPQYRAVILVGICLYPATVFGGLLGVAQGRESFVRLATLCALTGTGRAIGGIVGVFVGGTLNATLIGMAAGSVLSALVGWVITRPLLSKPAVRVDHFRRDVLHATHAMFALFVLTNIDVLLARHYLPATQAGMYAAGAVVAKVTFWLPQFVATVTYPRLADHRRARTLGVAALAVFGIGAIATGIVSLLPNVVVEFIGGAAYQQLAGEVWIFAAAGSAYALAQFLLYGQLAASKRSAIVVLWIAVVALLGLVIAFHSTVLQIATIVLSVASAVATVGIVELLLERRHESRDQEQVPA